MALLPGSAAIGAGTISPNVIFDQRGAPHGLVEDIGAFQSSLVVESSSGSVNTTASGLTLPGALSLANQFPGSAITFDPTVFATRKTITPAAGLELSATALSTSITGPAAGVSVNGAGLNRVFLVESGATANLTRLTISDGKTSDDGAGLSAQGTARVTLTDCTISGNVAGNNGGGLDNSGTGDLFLYDCTLSGNTAGNAGGGLDNSGAATLTDCTISGNSANVLGGGLNNDGTLGLNNCTISSNMSAQLGGGLANSGTATLLDTIVAANTKPSGVSDIHGSGNFTGFDNLIGTGGSGTFASGVNSNIVLKSLASLGLAPLGSYGGLTQTVALLPGSAAIGMGVSVPSVTTDQRGKSLDSPNDIGAFQSQGFTITPESGGTPQTAAIKTAFANPLSVKVTAKDSEAPVSGGVIFFAAPSKGASGALSSETATIGSNDVASVTATANSSVGSYAITASTAGASAAADFKLTNSRAKSRVVLVLQKSSKSSLGLKAEIEPLVLGVGVPSGSVVFEVLQKNKKPNVLGKVSVHGGTAKLSVKPGSVLQKSLTIVYSGDAHYLTSTLTEKITAGPRSLTPRPKLRTTR